MATIDQVFNVNPQFVFRVGDGYGTLFTTFDMGPIHRRAIRIDKSRRFRLIWNNICFDDRDSIRTFHKEALGSVLDLKWTPPNEASQIRVKFVDDVLRWTRHSAKVYRLSFEFDEIYKGEFSL